MDPLTHTLIGANLANAFFKKKNGPEAVPILCWASNLPDLDVAVLLSGDPLAVTLRRTFGHSLLTAPLLVLGLAGFFKWKYPKQRWGELLIMCGAGAAVHVFFDLVNSFGVRLLWPLDPWRPELAIIFIIDLFLTGLLALPYLLPKADRTRWAKIALCLVAVYVNFCELSRRQAVKLFAPLAQGADFSYVFPEPLGPHRWRGVARRGSEYSVYLVEPWAKRLTGKGTVATDLDRPEVVDARRSVDGRRVTAFFKAPVWSVDAHGRARVYDLRFTSLVMKRRPGFSFSFDSGLLVR